MLQWGSYSFQQIANYVHYMRWAGRMWVCVNTILGGGASDNVSDALVVNVEIHNIEPC